MRVRAYGAYAVLVEVADLPEVMELTAALRATPLAGLVDLVPAARTVLLCFGRPVRVDAVREELTGLRVSALSAPAGDPVEIAVVYDGADLAEVAAATGLSPAEVIEAHTGRPWVVAFTGFSPGFAYLTGGDPRLEVARRAVPRTRVPAGSVALAGEFTGVYPAPSPGGWQLIGRTPEVMWDLTRGQPARLVPGMSVRFRAIDPPETTRAPAPEAAGHPGASPAQAAPQVPASGRPAPLQVVATGLRATVQDGGRTGYAGIGVSPSGAADRGAWARGNRLVGNVEGAASIEVTMGGLTVRSDFRLTVAVTGANVPADVNGRPVGMESAVSIPAGGTLHLGRPERGLRSYVAVRGGIDVPPVLGSRSRDDLAGLGPAALVVGDRLPIGTATGPMPDSDIAPQPGVAEHPRARGQLAADAGMVGVRCHPGPRADWFTAAGLDTLVRARWTASDQLDRVGVRLVGPPLVHADSAELASEGIVRGAVQVPSSGQPIVFLADHPTTGGYPVIAVVTDADIDRLAQVRPGQPIRLRWV